MACRCAWRYWHERWQRHENVNFNSTDLRGSTRIKHGELTEKTIVIFFNIYNELGHGFLESVYEEAFSVSLAENGIFFQRQLAVPVWFHGQKIGDFRADLLVDSKVIVELKAARQMDSSCERQLLNYLRATDIELEILFNFGP